MSFLTQCSVFVRICICTDRHNKALACSPLQLHYQHPKIIVKTCASYGMQLTITKIKSSYLVVYMHELSALLYMQLLCGFNPSHKTIKAGHENDDENKQIKVNGG